MRSIAGATLVAAIGLVLAAPACAQSAGPPWPAEVSVPSSHRVKFTSAITGESYTLFIRVPLTPPPPGGYPVLYVLDGDVLFGMASDVSLGVGDPSRTPLVVAIGHGVFDDMEVVAKYTQRPPAIKGPMGVADMGSAMNVLRFHDYTLPVDPSHRAPAWTGLTPDNVGGVDQFLQVVEKEIKPRVAAMAPVNAGNQALFGHSIAGLAVLRALFTEPAAFRTFIAASPSIWWDADAVLKEEKAFAEAVAGGKIGPHVLICVGADEPDSPNPPPGFVDSLPGDRKAELTAYLSQAVHWSGMVSGSRDLAVRLGKLQGGPGYKVGFVAFADEGHGSVQAAALSRAVQFAFVQ